MSDEIFEYRNCTWHQNDADSEKWLDALEKTGPENVRARLANTDSGSRGAFSIGRVSVMTIGFAQEWLAWKDQVKARRDEARHNRQIFWTRLAALAACVAGLSAAIGWAWTIFHKTT